MASKSLLIDTATVVFQAGVLEGDRFLTFFLSINDTLPGFFTLMAPFVGGFDFDEIIFCEGPGKTIGIRVALMFTHIFKIMHPEIRTYSYSTFALIDRIRATLLPDAAGLVCIPKNTTQFYISEGNRITLMDYDALRSRKKILYCLETQPLKSAHRDITFIKYNLENHATVLRQISAPNDAIETAYDPQNDYKKWHPTFHNSP
ncbi:MAG: hypothetical protein LBG09_01050 [Puniceicoccales bacterium]|jgi:tRNA A37 threonylcarbamoyladenosine modification protein TsaB|nr:hypothetical protein [Puniceicoccales bacterium]